MSRYQKPQKETSNKFLKKTVSKQNSLVRQEKKEKKLLKFKYLPENVVFNKAITRAINVDTQPDSLNAIKYVKITTPKAQRPNVPGAKLPKILQKQIIINTTCCSAPLPLSWAIKALFN